MEQGPQGLYLKPPHGELSHSGVKTALAKAREFGFEGQPFALCSGLYGYGDLVLGDPEAVGVEEFDARFSEHRVSVKERLKWWPDATELFLYAYKEWVPYGKPRRVEVPAQVQTLMGPIRFLDEEAGMGEGVVINVNTAGAAPKVTEDVSLMKAMAGNGEAIKTLEEAGDSTEGAKETKVWKPSDAPSHTEAADTPKKRNQWAGTANGYRETCLGKIDGTPTEAQVKACEASAIRIANAAVKSAEIQDSRSEKGGLSLSDIQSMMWTALSPSEEVDKPYVRDIDIYDNYVTYKLEGMDYLRVYTIVDGKLQLGEATEIEYVIRPKDGMLGKGYKAELVQEFDALELGDKVLDDDEKAALTSAQRRALPNSAYAWVETGEGCEKVDGKTPEKCRHLPYKKADGSLDCARVRNARSVLAGGRTGKPMTGVPQAAKDKIEKAQTECTKSTTTGGKGLEGLRAQANKALEGVTGLWKAITAGGDEAFLKGDTGFKTFKAEDGKTWIITWTTNAFLDRDGEIFTTKSIEEYADRAWKQIKETGSKGQYDFYHAPRSEFADIKFAGAVGRFLVEMGTFHDDGVGKVFEKFFTECPEAQKEIAPDGWGTSHRFQFKPGDRDDGVFDWFDKDRTSVLAVHRAANAYTAMGVLQMSLNEEQQDVLKKVGEATGVDLLNMMQSTEDTTKTLEGAGVAYKGAKDGDNKEEVTATAAAAETEEDAEVTDVAHIDVEGVAQRVAQIMGLKELSEMLQDINGRLIEVEKGDEEKGKRLIEVEKGDDTRLKEKKAWQPNVAWLRPSTADGTLLDESKDKGLTDKKPGVPNAIQQVSKTILGNPVAGGRT